MSTWTPELKQEVIDKYTEANPTPETSTEIIKQIAEDKELSPNGVRMVLISAGVYVKKEASTNKASTAPATEGGKRINKEAAISGLKKAIENAGGSVDDEIIDKLTGKAAVYFTSVINSIK